MQLSPPRPGPAAWFAQRPLVRRAVAFYRQNERYAPALFFFGGVAWDAATLRRIDAWFDNIFLLTYLVLLGVLLLVALRAESGRLDHPWLLKRRAWFPAGVQFFLGALFSAYVVFYVQSASLTETSLFLVLLVGLLVANEFIHRRLVNLYLLFALYFLAAFSFFIFFVPVLVKKMNYLTFVGGGALALALTGGMLAYLNRCGVFEQRRQYLASFALLVTLFGAMNLFYLQNWIPPVPLALRHAGIYHQVQPQDGVYELAYERPPWYKFWVNSNHRFLHAPGERVYCFAAVFAPTRLDKELYHEWRHYDEAGQRWVTTDRIAYDAKGGRDGGYRWFSAKRNVQPGRWRVDVRTEEGRLLGRVRFSVEASEEPVRVFKWLRYR